MVPKLVGNVFLVFTSIFFFLVFRAMLGDAAPLVTIVRDPADAFESTYGYYNVEKVSGLTLAEFIKK